MSGVNEIIFLVWFKGIVMHQIKQAQKGHFLLWNYKNIFCKSKIDFDGH